MSGQRQRVPKWVWFMLLVGLAGTVFIAEGRKAELNASLKQSTQTGQNR